MVLIVLVIILGVLLLIVFLCYALTQKFLMVIIWISGAVTSALSGKSTTRGGMRVKKRREKLLISCLTMLVCYLKKYPRLKTSAYVHLILYAYPIYYAKYHTHAFPIPSSFSVTTIILLV